MLRGASPNIYIISGSVEMLQINQIHGWVFLYSTGKDLCVTNSKFPGAKLQKLLLPLLCSDRARALLAPHRRARRPGPFPLPSLQEEHHATPLATAPSFSPPASPLPLPISSSPRAAMAAATTVLVAAVREAPE